MLKYRSFKNYLIYPKFQWKLIAMCMTISLIAPVMLALFQVYFFNKLMENGQSLQLPETHPYFVFLNSFQDQFIFVFLASVATSFLICLIFGFLLSHRVAGPLVKMLQHFNNVALGQPEEQIQFRKSDFFQEVAEAYNKRFKK